MAASSPRPAIPARVCRTHEGAEHCNTLVDRRYFFELALPVLEASEAGEESYPSADARLSLTSKRGYAREIPISQGMRTDDGYCSFRFDDVPLTYPDDDYAARLVWDDGEATIFENHKILKHILAARKAADYVPPFPKRHARPRTDDEVSDEPSTDGGDQGT